MLRAADDDESGVERVLRGYHAKARKAVVEKLAEPFPPVREDASLALGFGLDRVDHPAVGTRSSHAEKIALHGGVFERYGEAQSEFHQGSARKNFCGGRNVPGKAQLFGEDVGGSSGQQRQGNLAAARFGDDAVQSFIHRAIAAADDDQVAPFARRPSCEPGRLARCARGAKLRLDSGGGKNAASLFQLLGPLRSAAAGAGVMNQKSAMNTVEHFPRPRGFSRAVIHPAQCNVPRCLAPRIV